jgi:hypothetical protein
MVGVEAIEVGGKHEVPEGEEEVQVVLILPQMIQIQAWS